MAQGSAHIQIQMALQEQLIRAIVREEIVRALELMGITADRSVGYYTDHIETTVMTGIRDTAQTAVRRMRDPEDPYNAPADATCPACRHLTRKHGHLSGTRPGQRACYGCTGCTAGEAPDDVPANPFETKEEPRG